MDSSDYDASDIGDVAYGESETRTIYMYVNSCARYEIQINSKNIVVHNYHIQKVVVRVFVL